MGEERKLELKDICGYLPYGLKALCTNEKSQDYGKPMLQSESCLSYLVRKTNIGEKCIILRPLSDIYRVILHNGERICPIVELARIHSRNYPHPDNPAPVVWRYDPCSREGDRCASGDCDGVENFMFTTTGGDDSDGYGFYVQMEEDGTFRTVNNQRLLWDYLDELKIDYRNLIENGLAVSVYDVKGMVYG